MKETLLFLVCCLMWRFSQGGREDYEITYPERLHNSRSKRDLSTANENGHEDSATFALEAFNKNWIMDAKQNDKLISDSFSMRTFDSDDNEIISKDAPDFCHYQGSLRGIPDSTVVLSTCSGLKGIIDDGQDSYQIEPHGEDHQDTGAHKIFKDNFQFDASKQCGTDSDQSDSIPPITSGVSRTINRMRRDLTSSIDAEDVYIPYLETNETKYIEVAFVADNGVFQEVQNNSKVLTQDVLNLCNGLDAVYQRINVRVVAAHIEIWTNGDRMNRSDRNHTDFGPFKRYRLKELVGKVHHDNAQFLSHKGWRGADGLATVGTICSVKGSCAVNHFYTNQLVGSIVTVAHEMGHNMGLGHSPAKKNCTCLTIKGCFMYGGPMFSTWRPGFTDCNMRSLIGRNHKCLFNVPTKNLNARCGNGIRENDEECDCGTPEMCKRKDPCCVPHVCRLKSSSQCSDLHSSCCKDCQFKTQGALCREAANECDVPEVCPGNSGECPDDESRTDGTPCSRNNKLLLGSVSSKKVVVTSLPVAIQARYVRINPQYWRKKICMRTEFLGCTADDAKPTTPSPIKMLNYKYCVAPKSKSCSPTTKTLIHLANYGYECKEKFMNFHFDSNGILYHSCTNTKVCPESASRKDGVKLMISSTCKDEDSKFIRTAEHSLKHVESGKCVHYRNYNKELVLRKKCVSNRITMTFVKQDCAMPLGISSGKLPDNQMTASSSTAKELPQNARLWGSSGWCTEGQTKNEYLQIDLGKTYSIRKIMVQGHRSYYVTGFFIQYSDDGKSWTGYTGSKDPPKPNTHCYSGKCMEPLDKQCRYLWGPAAKNAPKSCYDTLNTENKEYGMCDIESKSPCAAEDALCGQIQCDSKSKSPLIDYGKSYTQRKLVDSTKCSAVVLDTSSDMTDEGMVPDGTKCGDNKMCIDNKCKSFKDLNLKKCPIVNGKECNGRGLCTNKGRCQCNGFYDSDSGCVKALTPRDGGLNEWSNWSKCTAGCNGGRQGRGRFCNNPFPLHGGKGCAGLRYMERDCNTDPCPKGRSCRHIQYIAKSKGMVLYDGVYDIYPKGISNGAIKTYCDMSRDGGGWTLLVTSATNIWTKDDITLKNAGKPMLTKDYSILKYADDIKNDANVKGNTYEYRIEADQRGHWGGIWEVDRSYTFTARDNKQTNVKLLKKFDNWVYSKVKGNSGIFERMPWIDSATLTTNYRRNNGKTFGSIIHSDRKNYNPAPWINGQRMMTKPQFIWYWMREGPPELDQYA